MKLKENARVETADGQIVGQIDRVVMDPRTKEVTHVVVHKGLLFTEDKVVPISLISGVMDDRVVLREDVGDLENLPDYEETSYTSLDEYEQAQAPAGASVPPVYWYPPYPTGWGVYPAGYLVPQYIVHTKENIPEGTVALEEGAKVISSDGQHVGNVEQVLTDSQVDRATHFVISQGMLLKTRKLLPTGWISHLDSDEVHLAVGAPILETLREYHPQAENES
jgi:uncharacterized protein YrrD